ncbi:MAG TPA: DUF434 domain-containing protein [Spirochaetota bacterium]|nr:DUF434 domain-containing protein [Spirochaetota bacterium]HOL56933.1 DUF434 domain-containing protein [Spirochaetota bacterium]HPP04647.1 DUF434 domain-containing protein [Spirochaetota bacterium]
MKNWLAFLIKHNSMKEGKLRLKNAIKDYLYFIERGYSVKSVLKLISDHYRLNKEERTLLFRGVFSKKICKKRKNSLVSLKNLKNKTLHCDGFNIIFTILSYLYGIKTFIGLDSILRDASESHNTIKMDDFFKKAIDILTNFLTNINIKNIIFYFDYPISHSKDIAFILEEEFCKKSLPIKTEVVQSPDFILKNIVEGIISTSDGIIIDNSKVKVFDLARNALDYSFKPKYFDLRSLI